MRTSEYKPNRKWIQWEETNDGGVEFEYVYRETDEEGDVVEIASFQTLSAARKSFKDAEIGEVSPDLQGLRDLIRNINSLIDKTADAERSE